MLKHWPQHLFQWPVEDISGVWSSSHFPALHVNDRGEQLEDDAVKKIKESDKSSRKVKSRRAHYNIAEIPLNKSSLIGLDLFSGILILSSLLGGFLNLEVKWR